jgi:hypothetical protein
VAGEGFGCDADAVGEGGHLVEFCWVLWYRVMSASVFPEDLYAEPRRQVSWPVFNPSAILYRKLTF